MSKKKILLICRDSILGDPRIERMYHYLKTKNISLDTMSSKNEKIRNHKKIIFKNKNFFEQFIKEKFYEFFFKYNQN